MVKKFKFNPDKAQAALLYILEKLGGRTDFHKAFKVLYFAEREHLSKFSRPIVSDYYVAMKNGPVPSKIYDSMKAAKNTGDITPNGCEELVASVDVDDMYIKALQDPDLDELSVTDRKCLDNSISEHKHKNFKKLSKDSHDYAWHEVSYKNDEMDFLDIAIAGDADEETLKFIEEKLDYSDLRFAEA